MKKEYYPFHVNKKRDYNCKTWEQYSQISQSRNAPKEKNCGITSSQNPTSEDVKGGKTAVSYSHSLRQF